MYISPHHPSPPRGPEENGRRLATFPRGAGAELRVNLAEYEGHPFVSLRVWERGTRGAWWPGKRGVSVRLGEIPGLIDALRAAEDGPETPPPRAEGDRPAYVERRPQRREPVDIGGLGADEPKGGFDEF